jgi:SPX domain protein involved in polyphosphate accumulation
MKKKKGLSSASHARQPHHLARPDRQFDFPLNRLRKISFHRLPNYILDIITIHRDDLSHVGFF